jgi:hypothetical protein
MVSNSLKMTQKEIVAALKRLSKKHSDDPEYQKLRRELPKDWPL